VGVVYGVAEVGRLPVAGGVVDGAGGFVRYEVPCTADLWQWWSIRDAGRDGSGELPALEAVVGDFRPDVVHIVDMVNLPSAWVGTLKSMELPILRQVWNCEDLCGLIEPIFSGTQMLCPAPITPAQCADCCAGELASITMSAGTYPVGYLSRRVAAVRQKAAGEFEKQLIVKRARTVQDFTQHYDRIVFPSRSFREFFERTLPLPPERTTVIEPGVDSLPASTSNGPEIVGGRPVRGEPNDPVRFLFLGGLMTKKGIAEIQAAFMHQALLNRNDYSLAMYGGGNPATVAKLLAANSRVQFLGPYRPEQLPDILQSGDVGLSPSRFETFHRVTREYLQVGLPVIGSTAFGIPDAVRDGVNGLIFQTGDANGLRGAVLSVLDDRPLLANLSRGASITEIRPSATEIDDLLREYSRIARPNE
jgi:glycosyltransferase involved in cell wall biosynthesis